MSRKIRTNLHWVEPSETKSTATDSATGGVDHEANSKTGVEAMAKLDLSSEAVLKEAEVPYQRAFTGSTGASGATGRRRDRCKWRNRRYYRCNWGNRRCDRCKWRNRRYYGFNWGNRKFELQVVATGGVTGATAPTGSSGTATTGSTGLESTGASELVVESPKLTANMRPRNMSELMNPKDEGTSSKSIVDLDTAAKEMLGSEKSSVMQQALIDKLRESGIEVKSSDISIGSKPLNSEVDDLIEKHFVPTKNRSPVGPVVTGHSHSATLSNTIETALFLENAESIESAETACKGIGRVVDDGLGG